MPGAVDLLVFGPHPDDLEIGLGGSIAKHVALGHRVGLCDLTRGELGTNGTPEERLDGERGGAGGPGRGAGARTSGFPTATSAAIDRTCAPSSS